MLSIFSGPRVAAAAGEDDAESRLVAAAKADPRAFGPLYERYHDRIYRYCYTRLGRREAAEDAAGEVFLKAFVNLHQFRGGVFAAWLYTIARNAVADYYKRNRPAASWHEAEGAGGDGQPERRLERMALVAALAQLPGDQRAVIELGLSGWSGAETAAALGKSVAAVKMLRYRAKERLAQLLEGEW